jgi:NitT/TauT family transport system substrate-binding protein
VKISNPVFLIALLLSACSPAAIPSSTAKPIHLKVGLLPYLSYGPLFIAQEDGYFAGQGLDVEFVSFGLSDTPMIAALSQSQLDVAPMSMTAALLNAVAAGAHIRLVADKGFANPQACATAALMASKKLLSDGSLKDPAGLKGKTVAVSTANAFEWVLEPLLKKAGLTRNDVHILHNIDPAVVIAGLQNGSIDVGQTSEPWIARARQQGAGDVWMPFSDLMPNASLAGIVYGPSLLDRNPDVGVRFMTAYLKGIRQLNQGKTDSNVAILARYTKLSPAEIKDACWPSFQRDGKIAAQGLLDFQQWTVDRAYVSKASELSGLWDPQFVDAANSILK